LGKLDTAYDSHQRPPPESIQIHPNSVTDVDRIGWHNSPMAGRAPAVWAVPEVGSPGRIEHQRAERRTPPSAERAHEDDGMRIGVMAGATQGPEGAIDGMIARAVDLESRGFASVWMANIFGLDAISTLALVGRETKRIELATAVVPTFPRHPVAIAQQALTTQAAAGGRFALGIGLSHKIVIEDMLGFSYERPARHMREYLEVLTPLLRGEPAKYAGEQYRVSASLQVPGADPVPLLVAALGDVMLRLAGSYTDGTILWMTGPATIESHIAPKLGAAASSAGRPEPRIVAGFPIALTQDADAARQWVGENLAMYGMLPSYRAMLDKEGAGGPADIAIVGDEKTLDAALDRLRDVGVTDFSAAIVPVDAEADARTLAYLESKL
jgi:F420-dependent oxidoreductase-like protein